MMHDLMTAIEQAVHQRKIKKELAFRNALLATQLELSPDGIITTDKEGVILRVNANAEKMTGRNKNELEDMHFIEAIGLIPAHKDLLKTVIDSVLSGNIAIPAKPIMVMLKNPSTNESLTLHVKIDPARFSDSNISEMIFIFTPYKADV